MANEIKRQEITPLQESAVNFVAALSQHVDQKRGVDVPNGTRETQQKVAAIVREKCLDTANIKPGDIPMPPESKEALLIEALRSVNRMGGLLNEISAAMGKLWDEEENAYFDEIFNMLRRRFSDCGGVHLFIAADNLRIELPPDLAYEPSAEGDN